MIVIKGVLIDFKEEKDIYEALRLENQKWKAFLGYRWPKCFSGRLSDKTQARNVKVEVIDWKTASELVRDRLLLGGERRIMEVYNERKYWEGSSGGVDKFKNTNSPPSQNSPQNRIGAW